MAEYSQFINQGQFERMVESILKQPPSKQEDMFYRLMWETLWLQGYGKGLDLFQNRDKMTG